MARKASPAKVTLVAMSDFRYTLRKFLRFSEDAANAEGITALQYQVLLHICGFPERDWASIGEISERLQQHPHGTVALISRCEEAGLVERRPGTQDRRQVQVHLLPKGRQHLSRLAALHLNELQSLYEALNALRDEPAWLNGGVSDKPNRPDND